MSTVNTQVTAEIVGKEEKDHPSEPICSLDWEIDDEEDNENPTAYYVGSSYKARLYKGQDILSVNAFSTSGSLSYSGTGSSEKTEQISFNGERTSNVSYTCAGGFSYSIRGKAFDLTGKQITPTFSMPGGLGTVYASADCFAVIEVTYDVTYDVYKFSGAVGDEKAVLIATSTCGGELVSASIDVEFDSGASSTASCSSCCSSCCCSSSNIKTSVTLVYKDFVTGSPIEGASVFVDDKSVGTTNAGGSITVSGITTNVTHNIKASKEGYLTTDSDSLSNDSFIINS